MLLIAMMSFIPVFFFASEYAQISLDKTASTAGVFLLFFFVGFVVAAQIGGRISTARASGRWCSGARFGGGFRPLGRGGDDP